MLSEEKLTELFRYSFSLIDSRMTPNQQAFCRAIESAATAPLLARIAELERHNNELVKRREFDVRDIKDSTAKLVALERELEEARKAMDLARSWIAERPDLRQCSAGKVVSELTLALAIKEQT